MNRDISYTPEFEEFYRTLNQRTIKKLAQVVDVIRCTDVISVKFVKRLINTEFYEMRISTDNEYRVIIFAIDNDNIMNATEVVFLNGFLKKSTNDYEKNIIKARIILDKL